MTLLLLAALGGSSTAGVTVTALGTIRDRTPRITITDRTPSIRVTDRTPAVRLTDKTPSITLRDLSDL